MISPSVLDQLQTYPTSGIFPEAILAIPPTLCYETTTLTPIMNMQIAALELEKAQLKAMLKERVPDIAIKVENCLVDKYCYLEYTNVFNRNRTRALKVLQRAGLPPVL